jgi:hypothetical protein
MEGADAARRRFRRPVSMMYKIIDIGNIPYNKNVIKAAITDTSVIDIIKTT